MPVALPYPDRISQGASRKKRYRVLKAQFGDGYSTTAPDGINSHVDSWDNLAYENFDATERAAVWAAFDAVGGTDYLTWQPPGYAASLKWKLMDEQVGEQPASGSLYTITFGLRQVR